MQRVEGNLTENNFKYKIYKIPTHAVSYYKIKCKNEIAEI